MGRPKRLYPLGKYRLRIRGTVDNNKPYLVELEYTWNRQIVRKGMNIFVKVGDWNEKLNKGRGGVKSSYGPEANRINGVLLNRVDKIDGLLAEYSQKYPGQITAQLINDFLADKPVIREDKGKDFVEFAIERLNSDYSRNRIGRSRYMNGKSGMNMFQEFLRSTKRGTYKPDSIYVGEISVELVDEYITWRREIKKNSDATINHSLTPILKACAYATELRMIDVAINARIQDMRIAPKVSLSIDENEFDGKSLTQDEFLKLLEFYKKDTEPRRKEFIEMFLFAFHACGLRVVDVMTLQWGHLDFEKKELRKVMVKTNKRHVIPLSDSAIEILRKWKEKRPDSKYVFDLVKDDLDIDDEEELYRARNSATKCINQSLNVVGEKLELKFSLTMHQAKHFKLSLSLKMSNLQDLVA
ncbi:tyrosine-type recombinase/integrase [uncultured Bacteroides sp.]|uniref:tyrosine-type recombinase/integrase n=1 Tax=uncultured Bacteroides sp. TaxID=162156 RepID=UPI0025B1B0D7|nr:tyrosine-type recombinase/integrase [uncultured Bacteroides sp.]